MVPYEMRCDPKWGGVKKGVLMRKRGNQTKNEYRAKRERMCGK